MKVYIVIIGAFYEYDYDAKVFYTEEKAEAHRAELVKEIDPEYEYVNIEEHGVY